MRTLLGVLFLVCAVVADEVLLEQWRVQSSSKVSATPQQLSQAGFDDSSWYPASVPANGTVMAVLLQNNVYENITFGMNLLKVDSSQFDVPWWYRTEFNITSGDQFASITFKGINYKANIYLNGQQLGDISSVMGTFRYFTFDITQYASNESANALAVQVYRPYNKEEDNHNATGLDLSITFVDWAPPPPDANMGLWQAVVLNTTSAGVTIDYPQVATILNSDESASLTVTAVASNIGAHDVNGKYTVTMSEIGSCVRLITVPAGQTIQVTFAPADCSYLNVPNPKLWWPAQMGTPYLYNLTLSFVTSAGASFEKDWNFGIRQVTSTIDPNGHRLFKINGNNILIRGAGWAPDLFQRTTPERQEIEMEYVQHLGLNTIRLEGKFENDNLFDLADQKGILMLPGICCCDSWQAWDEWGPEQFTVATYSLWSQVQRLRIHPSVFTFMYSSDELPPPAVEKIYLSLFAYEHWPNPLIASADKFTSNISGPTGVKMSGPYSWVSPNYWLLDTDKVGGAFGFLTEGGPGEAPLTWDSFVQTFAPENYWPQDEVWNFHCGAWFGNFHNLDYFTGPLNARYGQTTSAQDYIAKSQLAAYEGQRAMFEGYSRNKYTSTGVIQWMLNNAFSEMIWHLYDIYLVQGGGYYGSKKACEPLHIMYSYNDGSIWIINSQYFPINSVKTTANVYNIDGSLVYTQSQTLDSMDGDASVQLFVLPPLKNVTSTYFLKLDLYNSSTTNNEKISDNFYWLSTAADVLDFNKSTWFNTPCTSYANFTLLQTLPPVTLQSSFTTQEVGQDTVMTVTVTNPTSSIALLVRLQVVRKSDGSNVVPIFWDDNFITLLPQETRAVNVSFYSSLISNDAPDLIVTLFNDAK